jgi:hypothetical protein
MVPILAPPFQICAGKKAVWEITFCQEASANQPIQVKGKMAPTIAPKISPTLRMGVVSTAGAKDGSPAADSRPVAVKRQKTAGGKIPRVSLNHDGARRRAKSLRLAMAKAAVDEKGPEVIPSDDDDERGDEATSTMPTKPRKGGRTTPVGKPSSAGRTAPGKAAKLRLGAASDETRAVARAGMHTATHLMMDDDNKDVNVATAIERGLAMATALGKDRIIGGPEPAGKTSSASKTAPGKAAKLRIGAVSDGMRAVARAGMPMGAHLTMDNDNKDVNVATASERGLAMRTALGNDRIIGGRVGANDRPGVAPGVHEPFRQGGCGSVRALPSGKVAGLPSHAPKRRHLCPAAWIAPEPQSPGRARSWPESKTSDKTPSLLLRSRCSTTMMTMRTTMPTTSRALGGGLKGIAKTTQPTGPVTGAER